MSIPVILNKKYYHYVLFVRLADRRYYEIWRLAPTKYNAGINIDDLIDLLDSDSFYHSIKKIIDTFSGEIFV